MQKKTDVLNIRVSPVLHQQAMEIVARTGPGTLSRYVRALIEDLVEKANRGEKIAEPPQVLTERQRRTLERHEDPS